MGKCANFVGHFEIFKITLKTPIISFMNSSMEATVIIDEQSYALLLFILESAYQSCALEKCVFNLKCKKSGGFIAPGTAVPITLCFASITE